MTERSLPFPSNSPNPAPRPDHRGNRANPADSQAIARLLNHKLQPHGIMSKAQFKLGRLEVLLESVAPPDQHLAIAVILGELVRLQIPALASVTLFARQTGGVKLAWTQTFDLQPDLNTLPSAALPETLADLRQRASNHDQAAMKTLIDRALAHKQIMASVTLEHDQLQIHLIAKQGVDQQSSLTLVCREVCHWHLTRLTLLCISGGQICQFQPDWMQEISLKAEVETTLEGNSTPTLQQFAWGMGTQVATPQLPLAQHQGQSPLAQPIDAMGWKTIAASLLLAFLLLASRQLSFFISPLLIMVHELGHASLAWLFGYGAIPAFDFLYGGGVTMQTSDRIPLLLFGIVCGFAYLCYRYRHNDLTSRVLLVGAIAYCLCAFTSIHNLLILAMGHGFELLFAGIFLYRALSGWGCRYGIERPLYGMLGFFMVFYDIRFAYGLLTNIEQRTIYEAGKGSILDNDFVRLAIEYFNVDLSGIVTVFLLCAIATPLITVLLFRYQSVMLYWLSRLLSITNK